MKRLSAEATAETFPEDIVIEILLRLPAKSLVRFKCVAKWWRSLISDPGFAKSHLQRLKAWDVVPSQRIFKTGPIETIDYEALDGGVGGNDDHGTVVRVHELTMDDPCWEPYLVGSCDGLVCLFVPGRFLIYNPTTGESRNLPGSKLFRLDRLFVGFGYDSRSDAYKIVQGHWTKSRQVVIFSLRSSSWRRTQARRERHLAVTERGVYWKGALHWCSVDESRNRSEAVIMSFDLSDEKFCRVLSVPEVDEDTVFDGLGVHGSSLFIYHGTLLNDRFRVWIRNDHKRGGSWTKLFSVWTDGISIYRYVKIPAYTRSGKIVFQIDMCQMRLFNPEDNTYKDYPIHSDDDVESIIYLETLVSPHLGCQPSRI